MIGFVNAKINIGLNIVGKREDGYHFLETIMYPVGTNSGTPLNPDPFCDILEVIFKRTKGFNYESAKRLDISYFFSGNSIECPLEKNLVYKATNIFVERMREIDPAFNEEVEEIKVILDKHLPDGAGMGGGSADAVFTMKLLCKILSKEGFKVPTRDELLMMAEKIGADCPFFVDDIPALAEGIGEHLTGVDAILKGMWLLVVKPELSISTMEAYSGVSPHTPKVSLADAIKRPLREWRNLIHNDFEDSLFPKYPELKRLKELLYANGAEYASMTGSGAALYGIFSSASEAEKAKDNITAPYKAVLLL